MCNVVIIKKNTIRHNNAETPDRGDFRIVERVVFLPEKMKKMPMSINLQPTPPPPPKNPLEGPQNASKARSVVLCRQTRRNAEKLPLGAERKSVGRFQR